MRRFDKTTKARLGSFCGLCPACRAKNEEMQQLKAIMAAVCEATFSGYAFLLVYVQETGDKKRRKKPGTAKKRNSSSSLASKGSKDGEALTAMNSSFVQESIPTVEEEAPKEAIPTVEEEAPAEAILTVEEEGPKEVLPHEDQRSEEPAETAEAPTLAGSPKNVDNEETQAMFDVRAQDLHSEGEGDTEKAPAERSLLKAGQNSLSLDVDSLRIQTCKVWMHDAQGYIIIV